MPAFGSDPPWRAEGPKLSRVRGLIWEFSSPGCARLGANNSAPHLRAELMPNTSVTGNRSEMDEIWIPDQSTSQDSECYSHNHYHHTEAASLRKGKDYSYNEFCGFHWHFFTCRAKLQSLAHHWHQVTLWLFLSLCLSSFNTWIYELWKQRTLSPTGCEGTVEREEEMKECSIRMGICFWNQPLFDVRWHTFASILGLISLSGKGVVCWCFWNECYINNKVAQAATEMRKLPTVWKEWLAKRCIDDEQAAGGEENTFSAWALIIYTASLLQTKNVITEKNEIILNKWYFSGCIACKDASLLNYFAVLTVQLYKKGKKNTVYRDCVWLIFQ